MNGKGKDAWHLVSHSGDILESIRDSKSFREEITGKREGLVWLSKTDREGYNYWKYKRS